MSDTPRTDKQVELHRFGPTPLKLDGPFADFARELERENAALREALIITTERLSHHVRLPVPVAPGLYATSAEEKASLEVLVKAWEVLYPKAQT